MIFFILCFLFVAFKNTESVNCFKPNQCKGKRLGGSNNCWGHFSCRDAIINGNAYCYSFQSCYNAKITGHANCNGFYGCQVAKIKSATVYAQSLYSAVSATIQANVIHATGERSLQSAKIEALGRSLTVRFFGLLSGYAATVRCKRGKTCSIECGMANGCHPNTKIYCSEGSVCIIRCTRYGCPSGLKGVG
eukprot:UN07311